MSRTRLPLLTLALAAITASSASAQMLDSATLAGFRWRTVGPANFEGRVSDAIGIPSPSKTFFVAAAGGGIWKSTNNGTTWRPIFDNQKCISMGMLAVAPSDTQQVWAGTGEPNSRNTIEPGCGIFKSTDGGMTWKHMGLDKTQHIGRIVVHPTNPNIVYVAALGAAWKNNPERGIYKTTDGGNTWQLIKFINDKTGFIDIAMSPKDPNTLYAAAWQRIRTPYSLTSGGPGSGLFKTTDGGATWTEIKGNGYPETQKGRIGLAISMSNPDVVYALTEADSNPNAKPAKGAKRQSLQNGLYRSADAGKTWVKTNDADTRPFYYSQVRVHPRNPDRVWFSSTPVLVSNEGGRNARTATQGIHVDHHAMWIDPNDPDRMIVGDDGGVSISFDNGGNWTFAAQLPIGQFYEVSYDFEVPYNICGGAQDNGAWCGPSKRRGPVTNAYWYTISGGDGFYTAQHPVEPWIVFGESQGAGASRLNLRTGERAQLVKPNWRPRYQQYEDSILYARGDTTQPATKEMNAKINELRSRQRTDSTELDMRFNWNSPLFISPHNPDVVYLAGNKVLKSTQRGDNLYPISPDLSKKEWAKIDTSMRKTGGITIDATGAETYGTVVVLAESYVKPGILWAGTDDGNVWLTRNDGGSWEPIPANRFPGLPAGDIYVSRAEPSHYDSLTAYITFDNHRWNDFNPYVYMTTDGGKTFKSIVANLPKDESVRAFREDPVNPNLLYVGTAMGVYVSLDHGMNWQKFMTGLPNVPVYDLKIHPRDRELIAATHGRGFWIVDVSALQQMNTTVASKPVYLFEPRKAFEWGEGPQMGASANGAGQADFEAPSPQAGAEIVYRLATGGSEPAHITITDARGDTMATLNGPGRAGVQKVVWNMRGRARPAAALSPSARRDSILASRRAIFVADSLEKAGSFPKAVTDRLRQMATGQLGGGAAFGGRGGGGGGGGGGGRGGGGDAALIARLGPGGSFQARPGEGAPVGAGGGGGGGGRGGAGALAAVLGGEGDNPADAAGGAGGLAEIAALLAVPGHPGASILGGGGGRGGGGGFGGGGAPAAATGDYLVTLRVGNEVQKQVLRVEHVRDGAGAGDNGPDNQEREPAKAKKQK